jgi:hypothetical protein
MYYCYICEIADDDYDFFTTLTIDWNRELVCMNCAGIWEWNKEEGKE